MKKNCINWKKPRGYILGTGGCEIRSGNNLSTARHGHCAHNKTSFLENCRKVVRRKGVDCISYCVCVHFSFFLFSPFCSHARTFVHFIVDSSLPALYLLCEPICCCLLVFLVTVPASTEGRNKHTLKNENEAKQFHLAHCTLFRRLHSTMALSLVVQCRLKVCRRHATHGTLFDIISTQRHPTPTMK